MVRARGTYTKNVGKLHALHNRNPNTDSENDSDQQSDSGDEEEGNFAGLRQHALAEQQNLGKRVEVREEYSEDEQAASEEEEEEEQGYQSHNYKGKKVEVRQDLSDEEGEGEDEDGYGEQGEEEEYEDEREALASDTRKRKKESSAFFDEAAEESEEEEELDEGPANKKKHRRVNFIDDEAEDDDDEEEEDEEGDALGLIDDEGGEEEEARAAARSMHQARSMENRERDGAFHNEEDIERFIQERYGSRYAEAGESGEAEGTEVEQQAMLPTVRDPKLWIVRCRPGHERELCVQIMQKFIVKRGTREALQIKSALVQDHVKGYIYVEADKQSHVDTAVKSLRDIFNFKGAKLVPIAEMTEVMSIKSDGKTLLRPSTKDHASMVRLRNGQYKGDLAQVLDVHFAENQATVKLVPRVDLQLLKDKHDGVVRNTKRPRAPQRMFSKQEAKDMGLGHLITPHKLDRNLGQYFDYMESMKFQGGYLIKTVAINSCSIEPGASFDELQKFHAGATEDDENHESGELQKLIKQAGVASEVKYTPGDAVIVSDGDLKNLIGTVDHLDADGQVVLMPKLKGFQDFIRFPPSQLSKYFKRGDHVKVTAGRHEGDTGLVVANVDGVATVFTDITQEELKVFVRDLVECQEEATGLTTFGHFELHDLVALDPVTTAIIVKVEKEACKVLTGSGTADRPDIRSCRLPDLKRKLNNRNISALDASSNTVSAEEIVRVIEGPLKGKQATVKHIHKGVLYCHCREVMENGGIVAIRAKHATVHGGKQSQHRPQEGGGAINYPQSPGHGLRDPMQSPNALRSPASPYSERGGGGGGRGTFSGNTRGPQRDDGLIGTVLKVRSGPWKGYKGKVKDATETTVRLELEALYKTVSVPKSQLALGPPAGAQGGPMDRSGGAGNYQSPRYDARSPYSSGGYGAPQTPAHYGASYMQTPMRGDQTPMRDAFTRTPMRESAWNPAAATPRHTPAWQQDEVSVDTPGGFGAGSAGVGTPGGAYDNPAHQQASTPGGAFTPYDSYTPHETSATTPHAATPHEGPASTPHAGTPGYYAGTPAFSQHASTPGMENTPGGFTPSDLQYSPAGGPAEPSSPGGSSQGGEGRGSGQGGGGGASGDVWPVPGLLVRLRSGEEGMVRTAGPDGRCMIQIGQVQDGRLAFVEKETNAMYTELHPVPPVKWDNVRVVRGPDRGMEAQLIGVDGADGVLKDARGGIKILDMGNVAKMLVVD